MLVSKVIQVLLAMTVQNFPADYLGGMVLFGKRTVLQLKIINSLQSFSSNQLFVRIVKTLYGKRQYFLTFLRKAPKGVLKSNRVRDGLMWKWFFCRSYFSEYFEVIALLLSFGSVVDKLWNYEITVSINQSINQSVIRNSAFESCNTFHNNFKWKNLSHT